MNSSLFKRLVAHFLDHADHTELPDGTSTLEFDGMLERDEPLTFIHHGHAVRAWVYRRYNSTEVLHIETEVGEFDDHPSIHHFIATSSGRLPFATIYVDQPADDGRRVHVACCHAVVAASVTSTLLGEVLDGLTYSALRARGRLSTIETDRVNCMVLDDDINQLIDEINGATADDDDIDLDDCDDCDGEGDGDFVVIGDAIADLSEKFDDVTVARVHTTQPSDRTDDILRELDALVGLTPVKSVVRELAATHEIGNLRRHAGLAVAQPSPHLVFTGNPGTGKTTVARLVGRLYRSLGMLSKGHVVETDRSGLVAAYVGQTALKTRKICESALGGVLFIDEAYALAGEDRDYGIEAIETLLTFMESHRGDIAVVVAGYPVQMETFVQSNPGLRSRFDITVNFPDFTDDELTTIFLQLATEFDYTLDSDARLALAQAIAAMPRRHGFGNGRDMRKLFHTAIRRQAQLLHANAAGPIGTSTLCDLTADAIGHTPTNRHEQVRRPTPGGYL